MRRGHSPGVTHVVVHGVWSGDRVGGWLSPGTRRGGSGALWSSGRDCEYRDLVCPLYNRSVKVVAAPERRVAVFTVDSLLVIFDLRNGCGVHHCMGCLQRARGLEPCLLQPVCGQRC